MSKRLVTPISYLLLVLMGIGFFVTSSILEQSYLIKAWWDLGHVLFFFLLAYAALQRIKLDPLLVRVALVLIACMGLGIVIEAIQFKMARDASLADVAYNFLGTIAGAYLYWRRSVYLVERKKALLDQMAAKKIRLINRGSQFALSVGLILVFMHPFKATLNWLHAAFYPEQLLVVDSSWRSIRLNPTYGSKVEWDDQFKSTIVTFSDHEYAGFQLAHFASDWSDKQTMHIKLWHDNPDALTFSCRINDMQHSNRYDDRFNQTWKLKPGTHNIELNINDIAKTLSGRRMDMSKVEKLICFSLDQQKARLYLKKIYLK